MIRPATEADLPALLALEVAAFGDAAWSRELVAARVGQTVVAVTAQLLGPDGADHGNDDVPHRLWGSATVTIAGDLADLERIAVAPARRRTGLGRDLLSHAVGTARDAGAQRMLLEVREDNVPALGFYVASGFREIDRRRRYYRDGADAIVMERDL